MLLPPAPPVSAPAPQTMRATWVDRRSVEFATSVSRSPDGSLVAVATDPRTYGYVILRAEARKGRLRWRKAALPVRLGAADLVDGLAATGETVFVRVIVDDEVQVIRAKVPGEVSGRATVLRGRDADAVEDFSTVDATHVGVVGSRGGFGGPRQLVVVDTRGLKWIGPQNAPGLDAFYPSALTESGNRVSLSSQLGWRYPALPVPVSYRTADADVDASPTPDPATGTGEDVIAARTRSAPLENVSTDRQGGVVTEGAADQQLGIYSPVRPARILDVPVPDEFDASCRQRSPVVDSHSLTLRSIWRGPDAGIWALAGCGNAGVTWLVHWDVGTLQAEIVRIPSLGGGLIPYSGRGVMMADGAMYIPTGRGTLRVTGLRRAARPTAEVRAVTSRPGRRVRVEIACVGAVGGLCHGRVRVRDRAGTVGTLPYAVESGTLAMQPFVTREFTSRRTLTGKPRAVLLG